MEMQEARVHAGVCDDDDEGSPASVPSSNQYRALSDSLLSGTSSLRLQSTNHSANDSMLTTCQRRVSTGQMTGLQSSAGSAGFCSHGDYRTVGREINPGTYCWGETCHR